MGGARSKAHIADTFPCPVLSSVFPGIDQRQLCVLHGCEPRQQVELLEHEAGYAVAQEGKLVVGERCDVRTAQDIGPRVRPVQKTENMEQRGLARARWAHDSHELPGLDAKRDIAQRGNTRGAGLVGLIYVLKFDHLIMLQ